MTYDEVMADSAMRLPAWQGVQVNGERGWRRLTPREICMLADLFDGVGPEYTELGVTLGVLRDER